MFRSISLGKPRSQVHLSVIPPPSHHFLYHGESTLGQDALQWEYCLLANNANVSLKCHQAVKSCIGKSIRLPFGAITKTEPTARCSGDGGEATGSGARLTGIRLWPHTFDLGHLKPNASFSSVNVLNVLIHIMTLEGYLPCSMWSANVCYYYNP